MKVLHVAPGDSAGGSLREALRLAGRQQDVLTFTDDLSHGPIAWGTSRERAAWWAHVHEARLEDDLEAFWLRLDAASRRLVVWFGRHSASELAFFLALADRLGGRPYDVVDVTDLQWTFTRPDGTSAVTPPAGAVGMVPTNQLVAQLETARPISPEDRDAGRLWQHLRSQNAPFRVVTPTGLASAPIDHFDASILEQAARDWRSSAYVIGSTMAHNCDPYMQVGDVMLLARLVALVEEGKLLADGDPWDMRACRVRLPD
ncbi:MAG TPA: DUF3658 domain-containing protein [Reyranella sp.]|nr:DUF3658 domain-containing protein [Reyranella sp.]